MSTPSGGPGRIAAIAAGARPEPSYPPYSRHAAARPRPGPGLGPGPGRGCLASPRSLHARGRSDTRQREWRAHASVAAYAARDSETGSCLPAAVRCLAASRYSLTWGPGVPPKPGVLRASLVSNRLEQTRIDSDRLGLSKGPGCWRPGELGPRCCRPGRLDTRRHAVCRRGKRRCGPGQAHAAFCVA